jgi:anti-sigma factor RsiW
MLHCPHIIALIMGYLDDTLDRVERRAFEAHIADCRNCWRFLRSYRETVALGQRLRDEDIPPDVRERLETFLRDRLQRPS